MLSINHISKQFGSTVLFEDASTQISPKTRVALIGPNGSGKTTLIKMILGFEHPDSGEITKPGTWILGHLAQEPPRMKGTRVLEEVMRLDGRREPLLKERAALEKKLEFDHADVNALERLGVVYEALEHLDEYRLKSRAESILQGIGFKSSDFERPLSEFSGGWVMRVALARLLLLEPDLLILDEPTNHLDLESLLWLEDFLQSYNGAILLVSHDRAFLNRLAQEVLEVDHAQIHRYKGNLDQYKIQKAEREAVLKSQYEKQQVRIKEIQSFVDRFGAKATKARQAQSRLKELDRMEIIELAESAETIRFRFPPAPQSGREVVTAKHLNFGYETPLFSDLNLIIQRGSRIAITGVNGAGKTTLLKLISGSLDPSSGSLTLGHNVVVGYYAQHQVDQLDLSKTVLDELWDLAPDMPMAKIRAIAGGFLFHGDDVQKKCAVLSGGEKARVALAKLLLSPSNFLILDEPTNHLDAASREVLKEALINYEGTLCMVSHDRDFMSELVTSVLDIRPRTGSSKGSDVIPLLGSYQDYLDLKLKELKALSSKPAGPTPSRLGGEEPVKISRNADASAKRTRERRAAKLESEIAALEAKMSDLDLELASLSQSSEDPHAHVKIAALGQEREKIELQIEEKLSEWGSLN